MGELSTKSVRIIRIVIQWCFMIWVIGIGIRFGMFINAVESGKTTFPISRPPGVEGFLPIGALTSLKYWLVSGEIHPVHPAALVIFIAIVLMSLIAKKSFCSWLCPVGTLSEGAYKLGKLFLGRNFKTWDSLDVLLRGIKYLLLLLFVKFILLDMSLYSLRNFLDTPYWAMSDVKMLHFFTRMSATTIVVLSTLAFLSLLYKNFWCRYLCPYGALLGLASFFSLFKIRRESTGCTGCQSCTDACPSNLLIHSHSTVSSPECTGCLTCVSQCPEHNVLAMQPVFLKHPLPVWVFPAVAVLVFLGAVGAGIVSGHWYSSLSYADYQRLIPVVTNLRH